MTITTERKNPHTRRVVRGLVGRPPNAKWGSCSSWVTKPKAIQVSFDLVRDHVTGPQAYLLALGEHAGVPVNCEDFFARR